MDRTSWAFKVYGTPAPKGSFKAVPGPKGRARLVNQLPGTTPWQDAVARGAARVVEHYGMTEPLDCALGVDLVVTIEAPRTVTRDWPTVRGTGDVDKHERTVLDGLVQGGLIRDDSLVCTGSLAKGYPHTPLPGVLPTPGAFIRIFLL